METWFVNPVLGLSVSVLLLAVPRPLGAATPGSNSSSAPGLFYSTSADELSSSSTVGILENNATSTSFSGESLSPSQRNVLLTHTAETHTAAAASELTHPDTEGTQTSTESSSSSLETSGLSTEPLSSTLVVATTEASSSSSSRGGHRQWEWNSNDSGRTDVSPDVSRSISWTSTEDASLTQDTPDATLPQGDATASGARTTGHTTGHTDSTHTSTTISRAGERTLLSVTSSFSSSSNNSTTSAFTEDLNFHQPPSTRGIPALAPETEDYTHSAPSTRTDGGETTERDMTRSSQSGSWKTEGLPGGTLSLTEPPNATQQHRHTSMSEGTSDSTPPLQITELSTDQSDAPASPVPPVTSPEGPANVSGTEPETGSADVGTADVGTSTEASPHFSSHGQEGTEGLSSATLQESTALGLTTAPPGVGSSTETGDSSTESPEAVTESLLTTSPVPVTDGSQNTEEDTYKAFTYTATITTTTTTTTTTSTTTTTPRPPPVTSSSRLSTTTTGRSTSQSFTEEDTTPYTATASPSTPASTPTPLQTSAADPTRHASPGQTQGTSIAFANPTSGTTLQVETGSSRGSTSHGRYVTTTAAAATTTFTHSTPTRSTEALHTTGRLTERGTTELVATTSPGAIQPTKAPPALPRNPCVSNPCMNGGMCVSYKRQQFTCHCQQAWTGPTCNQDLDECERDPCPLGSRCVNTRGSFSCECALGFDLEDGRTCTRAKTFLGTFSVNRQTHDSVVIKSATMHEIQREIIQLLNASLSVLQGYSRSTLSKKEEDGVRISAVNMFSISTDVTSAEVYNSIQMSLSNCSSSVAHCRMVLHHQLTYHVESLCVAQSPECDTERSMCTDSSGTASCQCLQGYYKHNPDDLSCLECGDGYKLENGTCVPCMFGFGGFNCGNFYKLIAVVVSPAGGGLLLILIIALIVTCCKRDKNDINKIIFKSGDMQMSPYADFPKNNRISMEWGRETIEMQENGSTKNLLQMTDIYYSPALRNADLERNGLYPFNGLPGSRHSCIYPAQWNPSFISDDSRRRDYF